jgi:hypothetical protein
MIRSRTLVALTASFSLIGSGCCLVQTRKDTGEAYVLPVRQWSWVEWGCVLLIGCIAYVISEGHVGDNQLMRERDPNAPPMREPCDLTNPEFPVC